MASEMNIVSELRDITPLPANSALIFADTLAALAVGLLLALLIAWIVRLLGTRRKSRKAEALARLADIRALPDAERIYAQAVLLRDVGKPTTILRDVLYRPDAQFDPEALDAQVAKTLRAR